MRRYRPGFEVCRNPSELSFSLLSQSLHCPLYQVPELYEVDQIGFASLVWEERKEMKRLRKNFEEVSPGFTLTLTHSL